MEALPEERRRFILEEIIKKGQITVNEICNTFSVSEMTARRDLRELDREGSLQRVHGGAVARLVRSYEPAFQTRSTLLLDEKKRIGIKAAEFVLDGDSIALDTGTTTLELVRALVDRKNLTIVTSSIPIANEVINNFSLSKSVRLILTGGVVRDREYSLVGEFAQHTYRNLHVDKAFLGVGGISLEDGVTEYNLEDTAIKRALMDSTKLCVVLADHTKLGRTTFATVGPLSKVNRLITDEGASKSFLDALADLDIDIDIAD